MIERILGILKTKNISPAQFADMINVQRSSISHLVSGRNKPSLEFIQKILTTFPEINSEWLLFGKGEMQINGTIQSEKILNPLPGLLLKAEAEPTQKMEIKRPEVEKPVKKKQTDPEERRIEKIVWFYKDNTFREFYPE